MLSLPLEGGVGELRVPWFLFNMNIEPLFHSHTLPLYYLHDHHKPLGLLNHIRIQCEETKYLHPRMSPQLPAVIFSTPLILSRPAPTLRLLVAAVVVTDGSMAGLCTSSFFFASSMGSSTSWRFTTLAKGALTSLGSLCPPSSSSSRSYSPGLWQYVALLFFNKIIH